ncbi:MAG: efflux RND transporter permease subunit [bacterium]|nr:efflux RND transporter permease subunit [bacterium]
MNNRRPTKPPAARPSYLDRLTVDTALMSGFVAKYITNIRIVMLLILTILLLGITAYTQLPKRLNPEVKIPIITIVTILPGAGPSDVESLVTNPIEDTLRSLKDVDVIGSRSLENVSAITIQFESSVETEKARTDVQSLVDTVNDLPSDAQAPTVSALDFEDIPVWTFALITTKSYPDLMSTATELKEVIEDVPQVDRVNANGLDELEVVVEASAQKLATYNLNPFALSQTLQSARGTYPAGVIQTDSNVFALTIDPAVSSIDDIRNLPLIVNNQVLRLGEVATVTQKSKTTQNDSFLASAERESQRAVTFSVYKTTGSNIDDAGAAVSTVVDEYMESAGSEYQLVTLSNTSDEINQQFDDLLGEFRTTIFLVMGVLFLFLGLRQALISALTVPLTFLSAFFLMQFFGMSINFLSMFAFLLALGLLVDDTIVVVSAMTTYYKSGRFTPVETGLLVWRDTIIPIWSTTLTTIWSFVPLLLTTGIIGEFIKPIPIVVTLTMLSSTAIAVLVTLPLMIFLLKPVLPSRVILMFKILLFVVALAVVAYFTWQSPVMPVAIVVYIALTLLFRQVLPQLKAQLTQATHRIQLKNLRHFFAKTSNHGVVNLDRLSNWYRRLILRVITNKSSRRSVVIAVVVYSVFCFALLPLGFVKNEFFPKTDTTALFVELELPSGTVKEKTSIEAQEILNQLRFTPETEFVTADIGQGAQSGFGGSSGGSNLANFTLRLTEIDERAVASYDIAEDLRAQFSQYRAGSISVIEESGGPPAGADIQIKLLGEDLGELNTQADAIVTFLGEQVGVTNVRKSVKEGTSKLTFVPDTAKLAENGLSADSLGGTLRLYASGFTLDTMKLQESDTDETDVVFRLDTGLANADDLSSLSVTTPQGNSIPLQALGYFVPKANPTSIAHESFQRTISVTAAIRPGYSVAEENQKLESFADSLDLPAGYSWETGGVNEENDSSINSILQAMLLTAVLILITMVVQFASFRQAIIVIIVIPLAVSSVFLSYALTGTPLSFPALIGILALFGIVVTNSMFIVDKINLNIKEGMGFEESIADAGASRMEPIILTKLSTIFGLLPITISDPLWRGLGGAIISGLLVASVIMLLFIPALYYNWMKPASAKL